jgi:hypothetical protein
MLHATNIFIGSTWDVVPNTITLYVQPSNWGFGPLPKNHLLCATKSCQS